MSPPPPPHMPFPPVTGSPTTLNDPRFTTAHHVPSTFPSLNYPFHYYMSSPRVDHESPDTLSVATSNSLSSHHHHPSLMRKSRARTGVSRQVKLLHPPGPQSQSRGEILNQSAIARRHEAAAKLRANLIQGTFCPVLSRTELELNPLYCIQGLGVKASGCSRSTVAHPISNTATTLILNNRSMVSSPGGP